MRLKDILTTNTKLKFQLFKYNLSRSRIVIGIIWITAFFFMVFLTINSKVMQLDTPVLLRDQILIFITFLFALTSSGVFIKRIFFDK